MQVGVQAYMCWDDIYIISCLLHQQSVVGELTERVRNCTVFEHFSCLIKSYLRRGQMDGNFGELLCMLDASILATMVKWMILHSSDQVLDSYLPRLTHHNKEVKRSRLHDMHITAQS